MQFVEFDGDLYTATEVCAVERNKLNVNVMLRNGQCISYTCSSMSDARQSHKEYKNRWRHAITGVKLEPEITETDSTDDDHE